MTRLRALTEAGLLHPNPDAVLAPLFTGGSGFFLASDKVQVKYEMLRARLVEGVPVSEAAAAHGYSRAAFYLVAAAFDQSGMAGLVDERRGRRGPVKLRPEIVDFIRADTGSGPRSPSRSPTGSGCGCTGAHAMPFCSAFGHRHDLVLVGDYLLCGGKVGLHQRPGCALSGTPASM